MGAPRAPVRAPSESPDSRLWLGPELTRALGAGAKPSDVLVIEPGVAGDRIQATHQVPEHECALFVARTSPNVGDVDLFLFGEDGTLLGSDESPERSPALLICPPHPRHVYAVARIAAGDGFVAIIAQAVDPTLNAPVKEVLTQQLLASQEQLATGKWAALDGQIEAHRRRIGGSWRELRRMALPLEPGTPTKVTAEVPRDGCLDVLAVPSEDVAYLELTIQDADGRYVARGETRDSDRSAVLCSREQASVTIAVQPHVGRGLGALIIADSGPGTVTALAPGVVPTQLFPRGMLSQTQVALEQSLNALDYPKPVWQQGGALRVGERKSFPITLGTGCYRIDLLSQAPVQQLAAWVWDSQGGLIIEDTRIGQLNLFACTKTPNARLDVESLTRAGSFVAQVRPVKVPALLLQHPLAGSRLLGDLVERGRLQAPAALPKPEVVPVSATRLAQLEITIPAGNCADVSAALGPGALGLDLRLLDSATGAQLQLVRVPWVGGGIACAPKGSIPLAVKVEMRVTAGASEALLVSTFFSPHL
ncbi:MAG: hypothetical protein SFV15_07125 [Polyangiaceae bacterium]|nr:hypothetical protein [Polyangiaceae bacterium]